MCAPTTRVLRKVAARSRMCSHQRWRGGRTTQTCGWGCCSHSRVDGKGDAGSDIATWGQRFEVRLQRFGAASAIRPLPSAIRERLVNRLQLLAGLEADGLAGRNGNFGAGARIPSNAGLARTHVEHAETAQLNAIAVRERLLHALEDGFDGKLRLGLGDPGAVDHFVDDVELNHGYPPSPKDWYASSY